MKTRYTNRSGQIAKQRCPRLAYLGQFYPRQGKQVGLDTPGKPFQMLMGIYAHEGVARLLGGLDVDTTVDEVLALFATEISMDGIMTFGCDVFQVRQELEMMIEGLIRGWALKRLPYFLSEFTIIELEQDHAVPLAYASEEDEEIVFEFKPDAILTHKATGLNYVLSIKTTGAMDARKLKDAETDIQGLSEVWGAEEALGMTINGVIMEYLMTGKKDIDEWNGQKQWIQFSPLIRGWTDALTGEVAWRYQWTQIDHESGTMATKRLGKKFKRTSAIEQGGVKQWIDNLNSGQFFPNMEEYLDPLREVFISIEFYRSGEDMEEWLNSIRAEEIKLSKSLYIIEDATDENFNLRLRQEFPMYRHSCNYPVRCRFFEICHGSAGQDPLMNGYTWRESHHKLQLSESQSEG